MSLGISLQDFLDDFCKDILVQFWSSLILLNEVAVFNSNLAYATRLFTENTTTKQEKINILRRFDSVETLKESKSLYKTLKEEFESKEANTISESVSEKVSKTPVKGSSANLIESKTYENPQFMRMKDLMTKIIK